MDFGFPSEQLSLPHNLTHDSSDIQEDYSPHQSRAEFYPCNLQSNEMRVSSTASGSYSYPFYQYGPCGESEYLSDHQSAPGTSNDVSQFYPEQSFRSNVFEGHIGNDTRHFAPIQAHRAAGWGITNFPTVQEGTMNHLDAQGASGSGPPGSSSTTIVDTSPSLGFYSQYRVQDEYTRATSPSCDQVEGAAQSHAVTQSQDAAKQEAIQWRQQRKREKDRIRKDADRTADDRAYSRVCKLLVVKLDPKNTRSKRILNGVESIDQDIERVCELLEISTTPRKPLAQRILDVIERLVERQKHNNDLRRRFKDSEAKVALLESKLAQHLTESDTGSVWPSHEHPHSPR